MSVGTIWFVPGFLGSELFAVYPNGGRKKVWLDVGSALRGDPANYLVWGSPPDGATIEPGNILDFQGYGYPGLARRFVDLQVATGYQTRLWPYDWRKGVLQLGVELAYAIGSTNLRGDNKIVAHSYGGLVAWAACVALQAQGSPYAGTQVSTLLTLGAPMLGSYSSPATFRMDDSTLNIFALTAAVGRAANPLSYTTPGLVYNYFNPPPSVSGFLTMYASWPSVYDLYPDPSLTDDPGDAFRSLFWNAANFASAFIPPSASLLAASQNGWQKTRLTQPYAGNIFWPTTQTFLLMIAGRGRTGTPERGAPPLPGSPPLNPNLQQRRNFLPGYTTSTDGDGTVQVDSAIANRLLGLSARYFIVGASHENLPTHPLVWANMPALLNLPPNTNYPPPSLATPAPLQAVSTW